MENRRFFGRHHFVDKASFTHGPPWTQGSPRRKLPGQKRAHWASYSARVVNFQRFGDGARIHDAGVWLPNATLSYPSLWSRDSDLLRGDLAQHPILMERE